MGMDIAVLGVDLGKNVCSVVGLDASGAVVMRRKVRRETLIRLAEKLPPCVVGMEACCGAHHLGRLFAAHGHDVRLMSPEYVRPYVKAQKNDDRDAEGIAEATTRPTMRFVNLKSQDQLDMQTLHRSRDRLVAERTALINQLRAILLERGMAAPKGKRKLEQFLIVLMDEQGGVGLSPRMILLVETPARNGRSSIVGSPPSTPSLFAGPRRIRTPAGWRQSRASARSSRRLSSPPSVMRKASTAAAISPPGSV
jgi:transposase